MGKMEKRMDASREDRPPDPHPTGRCVMPAVGRDSNYLQLNTLEVSCWNLKILSRRSSFGKIPGLPQSGDCGSDSVHCWYVPARLRHMACGNVWIAHDRRESSPIPLQPLWKADLFPKKGVKSEDVEKRCKSLSLPISIDRDENRYSSTRKLKRSVMARIYNRCCEP